MKKPPLTLQTTTLWDYPSQHYGEGMQGDRDYAGATPSYVIWNLLCRYTRPGDFVVDPMAGSGTTLDVAADLGRRAMGFDVSPFRGDITEADARNIPLAPQSADFVFVDPPYSTHIEYSDRPDCIGRLDAAHPDYYTAMRRVVKEIHRILRPERFMALYVCDSFKKGRPFAPIGLGLFSILCDFFVPVDHVAVVRHNGSLLRNHWHTSAIEGNYFLRGFNHLFIMYKPGSKTGKVAPPDRRDPGETAAHISKRRPRSGKESP
jgi:DNA modification methylase